MPMTAVPMTAVPAPASTYPLNRSEHGYLALDGFAGSFHQAYLLRLDRPVDEALVRRVLRQLVSAFPRLRCIAVPGWHRHRWQLLPDDDTVDQLFDVAYRVRGDVALDDPAALQAHHTQLLNEPLPIEHGLAVRMGYYPHPQRPMIHLGVHHMLCDGRSMQMMISALLAALNGQPMAPVPMEAPSLLHTIRPLHWKEWPRKLLAARRHAQEQKRRLAAARVLQLPTRATPHYSAHAIVHHRLAVSAPELRACARRHGVSLNTLVVAAFSQAFLQPHAGDPLAASVIRLSVDLRRYFPPGQAVPQTGNYVAAFLVHEGGRLTLAERAKSVEAQVRAALARYERREMCWGYLFEELMPLLGRTAIAHIAWGMKRAGRFPRISAHATSLGDCNRLNAADAAIRLHELHISAPSLSPLLAMTELNGQFNVDVVFQRCETEPDDVRAWLQRLDALLLAEAGEAQADAVTPIEAAARMAQPSPAQPPAALAA